MISGLGQVGGRLARMLAGHGATLFLTDIDGRKQQLADDLEGLAEKWSRRLRDVTGDAEGAPPV